MRFDLSDAEWALLEVVSPDAQLFPYALHDENDLADC
jgi:hypothetical protein